MNSLESAVGVLPPRFRNRAAISSELLRFQEVDNDGHPFALHYFTRAKDLREVAENLEDFQDSLLGRTYFESNGDLRWNHYLYLIAQEGSAHSSEWAVAKTRIEEDRSYARKYVLTESELSRFFNNREGVPAEPSQAPRGDVVSRWTQKLISEGLGVILDQRPIAETIRLIGDQPQSDADLRHQRRESLNLQSKAIGEFYLSRLSINRYRQKLDGKKFELGDVNLIIGPNGAGKTSLLEAIEYLVCSETARSKAKRAYDIRGACRTESAPYFEVGVEHDSAELKRRNLHWYGVRDLRGSSLTNSFSRFNFLSTDEAVLFGISNRDEIEELLSKIVAGPQAADLWGHLRKVHEMLEAEVSKSSNRFARIVAERKAEEERLASSIQSPSQADLAFKYFQEDISRLKWGVIVTPATVSECIKNLLTASSRIRQIHSGEWAAMQQLSAPQLRSLRADVHQLSRAAASKLVQALEIEEAHEKQRSRLSNLEARRRALSGIAEYVNSGAQRLFREMTQVRTKLSECKALLRNVQLDSDLLTWFGYKSDDVLDSHVPRIDPEIDSRAAALEMEVSRRKDLMLDVARNLSALHAAATQLVGHEEFHDRCPLCLTNFLPDELSHRIKESRERLADPRLVELEANLDSVRQQQRSALRSARDLNSLRAFVANTGRDVGRISIEEAWGDLRSTQEAIRQLETKQSELNSQQQAFEVAGFTIGQFELLSRQAIELGVQLSDSQWAPQLAEVVDAEVRVSEEIDRLKSRLGFIIEEARREFASLAIEPVRGISDIVEAVERRKSLIDGAVDTLDWVETQCDVPLDLTLRDFEAQIRSAVSAGEHFISTEANTTRLEGARQEALRKVNELKVSSDRESIRLSRLRSAYSIVGEIVNNDSLSSATETELAATRARTQSIFGAIHSPHEYEVYGGLKEPLRRISSGEVVASLNEVSTGQRAAFVLSLFLAMNAQISEAPRVLLFDDPIAHLDDFNALSFLDHLRQVAIARKRQIFYATADSKIAGLFAHKFSFLGARFKTIELDA